MGLFANRVSSIGTENAFKLGSHIAKIESNRNSVIKLNIGEPDFSIPNSVKAEIIRQVELNNTHYCDPKGIFSLREALAHYIHNTRHINVSPEQIVIFPGAKPAIGFSQAVYCDPGDEVIYPSPGFPIYESFIRYLGAIPKPLYLTEETGFSFDAEQLEKLLSPKTKLIFLNFPSNPTGGVATLTQLEAISEIILRKTDPQVRVFSDEIYEHIIFNHQAHLSIASIPGMEKRTIISSGFSKSYAWTGGRIGYAVFPSIEEAEIFKNMNINYFSCVPPYNQEAAKVALFHPESQAAIKMMVEAFELRTQILVEDLRKIPGVSCQMPGGAFYTFPNIAEACETLGAIEVYHALPEVLRDQTSASTLVQMFALYHHGVACLDRRSFGKIGAENQHYLRLAATVDVPVLKEGVKRLKDALEDTSGFQQFIKNQAILLEILGISPA